MEVIAHCMAHLPANVESAWARVPLHVKRECYCCWCWKSNKFDALVIYQLVGPFSRLNYVVPRCVLRLLSLFRFAQTIEAFGYDEHLCKICWHYCVYRHPTIAEPGILIGKNTKSSSRELYLVYTSKNAIGCVLGACVTFYISQMPNLFSNSYFHFIYLLKMRTQNHEILLKEHKPETGVNKLIKYEIWDSAAILSSRMSADETAKWKSVEIPQIRFTYKALAIADEDKERSKHRLTVSWMSRFIATDCLLSINIHLDWLTCVLIIISRSTGTDVSNGDLFCVEISHANSPQRQNQWISEVFWFSFNKDDPMMWYKSISWTKRDIRYCSTTPSIEHIRMRAER